MSRLRSAILVAIAAMIAGPIAVWLGALVWNATQPTKSESRLPSLVIDAVVSNEDRSRFLSVLKEFVADNGFELIGGMSDRLADGEGFVWMDFARKDALQLKISMIKNKFSVFVYDPEGTGNAQQLRAPLVDLIESGFDIKVSTPH